MASVDDGGLRRRPPGALPVSRRVAPRRPRGQRRFVAARPATGRSCSRAAACSRDVTIAYETWGTLDADASQRRPRLPRPHRRQPRRRPARRPATRPPGWWDGAHRAGPGHRHRPLVRRVRQRARRLPGHHRARASPTPTTASRGAAASRSCRCATWVRSAGRGRRPPRHPALAQRRRRLDGRHAGARVGGDVPRPGARRSCPIATAVGGQRPADRLVVDRPARHPHGPALARRRLLRRRARRRARTRASPLARMVSQITFRSDDVFTDRFGREVVEPLDGGSRCGSASRSSATSSTTATSSCAASTPTSYLLLTKAMDLHDVGRGPRRRRRRRWRRFAAPVLAIGVASDILYPLYQSQEIVELRPRPRACEAESVEIDSPHGHDAFLIEHDQVGDAARARSSTTWRPTMPDAPTTRRPAPRDHGGHRPGAAGQRRLAGAGAVPVDHLRGRRRSPSTRRMVGAAARRRSFYSRFGSPTVREFEDAVAELEGAEAALAFGVGHGRGHRGGARRCARRATTSSPRASSSRSPTRCSTMHLPALRHRRHLRRRHRRRRHRRRRARRARRSWCSSRRRPTRRCRSSTSTPSAPSAGPITVVDSTFAGPAVQRPLDHGVDLVLHAATKGIAGHNDALLGVVAGERGAHRRHLGRGTCVHGRPGVAVRRLERHPRHPHAAGCASASSRETAAAAGRVPRGPPGGRVGVVPVARSATPSTTWPGARCAAAARSSPSRWPAAPTPAVAFVERCRAGPHRAVARRPRDARAPTPRP